MANFNSNGGVTEPPSFLRDSRGATSGMEPFAELFKGVGNVALQAVQVADQNNLVKQKAQIETGVNSALNDFGFRTEANSETNTPRELADYKRQLDLTHKAYNNGSLSESSFSMRIDALSRKVRSQYPGYDAEIDTVINQTLNRSTANDLRKNLAQEWTASASKVSAEESKWQTELNSWRSDGKLYSVFPDYDQRVEKGTEPSRNEVRFKVGQLSAQQADLDTKKKQIEFEAASGNLNKKNLTDTANQDIGQVSRTILTAGLGNENVKKFLSPLENKKPGDWTPEEIQGMVGGLEPLIFKAKTTMLERLSDPIYDTLSKQERDDAINKGLEPLLAAKEAVLSKDTGLLNVFKTLTDSRAEKDAYDFYKIGGEKGDPSALYARKRELARKVFGDVGVQTLDATEGGMSDMNKNITSIMKMEFGSGKSITQIIDDGKKATDNGIDGKVTNQVLTDAVKLVTDPGVKPEGKSKAIDMLFGEGNAKFLDKFSNKVNNTGKSDRMIAFEKLTSPDVSAAVALAGKTNPDLLNKYKDSIGTAFSDLFKKDIDSVIDVSKYSDLVSFKFNEKTLQFDVQNKTSNTTAIFSSVIKPNLITSLYSKNEEWKKSEGMQSLTNLNSYLKSFKPAMEAAGIDPKEALTQLFEVNGAVEQKGQPGSLFSQLGGLLMAGSKYGSRAEAVAAGNTSIFDSKPADGSKLATPEGVSTFLSSRSDKPKESIDKLDPKFASNVANLIDSAPPEIKAGLGLFSAARSTEHQKELWDRALIKYGSPEEARKWVAPPGHSNHEKGMAADLSFNGESLRNAPGFVVDWVHQHADAFGLAFPLGNENWHVEPKGLRKK